MDKKTNRIWQVVTDSERVLFEGTWQECREWTDKHCIDATPEGADEEVLLYNGERVCYQT